MAQLLRPAADEAFKDWVERTFDTIGVSNDKRQELDRILEPLLAEFEGLPEQDVFDRDYLVSSAVNSL